MNIILKNFKISTGLFIFLFYYIRNTRNKESLMSNSHGSLENIILNAIWYIEENNLNKYITVNDVFALVQRTKEPRAYTTIKTVMDRLVEKSLLLRKKQGKKFVYESLKTREESAKEAILKLANVYFNDDLSGLNEAVRKICISSKISV